MEQNVNILIEITREDHRLVSVKTIMPTWNRLGADGKTYISIPFLGLETCSLGDNDTDKAFEEALTAFCIVAEKHGLGLESELEFLGWTLVEKRDDTLSLLSNNSTNESIVAALSTGDTRAIQLNHLDSILEPV